MVSMKHIGTFFALAWLSSTISAQTGNYILVNKSTGKAVSVTSPDGVLKTVSSTGTLGLDETFRMTITPQSTLIRSVKYSGRSIRCPSQPTSCKADRTGTGFVIEKIPDGYHIRAIGGLLLTITDKQDSVFLKYSDASPNQLFHLTPVANYEK